MEASFFHARMSSIRSRFGKSMSMESEKKKRRLLEQSPAEQFAALRQLKGVTPATCRRVIATLREDGAGKRTCQSQKASHALSQPCLRHLEIPAIEDGNFVTMPCMSLPALVQAKVNACALYKAMLHEACQAHNGELTMVFYTDEVTGGNVLSAPQARKANLIYVNWLECPVLHMESQWLTLSVCRSSDINDMRGGMAALVTSVLKFIERECGSGFPIAWSQRDADLIRIKKIYILADAEAIRSCSGCKGHAGLKPCVQCINVTAIGKASDAESHYDITCPDMCLFWPQTDETVNAAANRLRAERTTKGRKDCEKFLGWNWENFQEGPLLAPELSKWISVDSLLYDSMHIFFNNGQICQLLGQWYAILVQHTTFTLCHLQTYASLWTPVRGSPAACGPKPAKYFNAKLWRADGDFRGDADAAAAVLALVVAFCEEVLVAEDSLKPYIESMQCLQKLVCCIWACKVSPSAALQLDELQKKHFDAYAKAWSKETIRPKWHYGLHVQAQVQRCNKMLDTWALERKHKFFKKLTTGNWGFAPTFAVSALLELSTADLQKSQDVSWLDSTLLGSTVIKNLSGLPYPCEMRSGLVVKGVKYLRDQYVLLGSCTAAQVLGGIKTANADLFLLVELLTPVQTQPSYRTRWKNHTEAQACALVDPNDLNNNIRVMYYRIEDDNMLSLLC